MHQNLPPQETEEEYKKRCDLVNRDIERQLQNQREREMLMQEELNDLKEKN
jgi:hypothetical protein